jgi:hypothetical protein
MKNEPLKNIMISMFTNRLTYDMYPQGRHVDFDSKYGST